MEMENSSMCTGIRLCPQKFAHVHRNWSMCAVLPPIVQSIFARVGHIDIITAGCCKCSRSLSTLSLSAPSLSSSSSPQEADKLPVLSVAQTSWASPPSSWCSPTPSVPRHSGMCCTHWGRCYGRRERRRWPRRLRRKGWRRLSSRWRRRRSSPRSGRQGSSP